MMGILSATTSNFTSIFSADKRAKQAKDMAEAQRDLALYNKQVIEGRAQQVMLEAKNTKEYAELTAHIQKQQVNRRNDATRASQYVAQSKSGISADTGTPILVQQDQLGEMKLMENNITYQGYLKGFEAMQQAKATAYALGNQAANAQYQADVAMAKGKYKQDAINYQKNLTIGKMFYDGANVTNFGEFDDPGQFQHSDVGDVLSLIGIGGSKGNKVGGAGPMPTSEAGQGYGAGGGKGFGVGFGAIPSSDSSNPFMIN
jgi:hypothetical protein